MNTYALSNCLAPSPEPFVSYKGQNRKVNTDITFLRRQYLYKKIDFAGLISAR